MDLLAPGLGTVVILAVLRDVFHTLFHPAGRGGMAIAVFRSVWALTGRFMGRARALSGPTAMVLVIASRILLLVVGWAHLSTGRRSPVTSSLPRRSSLTTKADFSPPCTSRGYAGNAWIRRHRAQDGALRLLAPLQATIGFALFTVAVTWVLSIYPALQRQRAFASLAQAIRESHIKADVPIAQLPQGELARQVERLAEGLASLRVDFIQYPPTLYFAPPSNSASIAAVLPYVSELAGTKGVGGGTQLATAELGVSTRPVRGRRHGTARRT